MTPEHEQKVTHRYMVHYPAHDPRESDPHKKDFLEWKRKRKEGDTYYCDFAHDHRGGDTSECDMQHPLEAHHKVVELAMLNEIDFTLLDKDFPGISNPDEAGGWIDSDKNLTLLCLIPNSPILMADGTERLIQDVLPGDSVITKDGTPQVVQGVSRNKYRGDVFTLGRSGFTPTHRILVKGGRWLPVAEIHREVGMHGPDMIRVRCVKHQVRREVVSPVTINVMNPLGMSQRASSQLLHDIPVLHDHLAARQAYPDIPLGGDLPGAFFYRKDLSGKRIQPSHPARIGAIEGAGSSRSPDFPCVAANSAGNQGMLFRNPAESATFGTALPGATRVLIRKRFRDKEVLVADGTLPYRQLGATADGWWDTPGEIRKIPYSGWVHDLIVPHNTSYVSSGVVVHNCSFHHRGPMGVHVASYSDFTSEGYVRNLIKEEE